MSDGREACLERSGFLFAHDCDQVAVRSCDSCNKPICRRHGGPAAGGAGVQCVSCRKEGNLASPAAKRREGEDDDDPYFYAGAYYDDYDYYDSADRRAFDRVADEGSGDGALEADFDGS